MTRIIENGYKALYTALFAPALLIVLILRAIADEDGRDGGSPQRVPDLRISPVPTALAR